MKRAIVAVVLTAGMSVAAVLPAAAANPPGTGQPSQSCLSSTAPMEPGKASSSPGSGFNENGGIAGGVYANPDAQGGVSSGNSHVVSQYDVACFQVSQH